MNAAAIGAACVIQMRRNQALVAEAIEKRRKRKQEEHDVAMDKAVNNFLDDYERTQGHRPILIDNRLPVEQQYEMTIAGAEANGDEVGAEAYRKMLKDMKAGKPSPWSDGKW